MTTMHADPTSPENSATTDAVTDTPTASVVPQGTTWTRRQNLTRALWMLFGRGLFRCTFHNWYGVRRAILRAFGATIARNAKLRPTVRIEIPWNLTIGEDCLIGDYAILYALGPITIGDRSVISQYAHLCAGTHDYSSRVFQLLRPPIVIGKDCWIATDAYVAPGVTVGDRAVLGARSSAYKNMDPDMIYAGNPAKPMRKREITS
jgi:putative colanic acid biosynthesis acetyltransferase WcaF